jgi:hypothetical protein
MPCCCASNIKAAKILGIVLAVIYGLGIVWDFTKAFEFSNIFSIVNGFLGVASASILAYGAHTRNSKAMLIYIYSTILMIILFIVGASWGVVDFFNVPTPDSLSKLQEQTNQKACNEYRGTSNYQVCLDLVDDQFDQLNDALKTAGPIATAALIFVVVIAVVTIIFDIWTIFVAKNAKKEIEAEK